MKIKISHPFLLICMSIAFYVLTRNIWSKNLVEQLLCFSLIGVVFLFHVHCWDYLDQLDEQVERRFVGAE